VIVVFGSINLDLIFSVPSLPAPGQTVLGPALRIEAGGKGANQAVAAARDGARVVIAGAVGRDALAEGALATLRAAGVDLSRVPASDGATGCAAVCVDPEGRNQIAVAAGANLAARAKQVEDAILTPDTTLLLQMEVDPEETAALIHRARARGAHVILNLAPAKPLPEAALRAVNQILVNEDEAAWLAAHLGCAAPAAALRSALGVDIVRTLGANGSEAATADGLKWIPAHPVHVVDTTAAGDCFAGVMAAALDRGQPLAAALSRASVAAALCCARPGSQGSLPTAAETDAAIG
jgi:ribokinase